MSRHCGKKLRVVLRDAAPVLASKRIDTRTEKWSIFRKRMSYCVVGNGPLSGSDRERIRNCDKVIRFNDMKNRVGDERVDVHVQREWEDTRTYAGSDISTGARKWLVGMHAALDATGSSMAIPLRGKHGFQPFPTCSKRSGAVDRHPSTGTIVLSALELDPSVERVEVFGMNWKFKKGQDHDGGEGELVRSCATKAVINETFSPSYQPPARGRGRRAKRDKPSLGHQL